MNCNERSLCIARNNPFIVYNFKAVPWNYKFHTTALFCLIV